MVNIELAWQFITYNQSEIIFLRRLIALSGINNWTLYKYCLKKIIAVNNKQLLQPYYTFCSTVS